MNCSSCGAPNRDTSRFCAKCGGPLPGVEATPPNPAAQTSYPSVYQQPGMSTPSPDAGLQRLNPGLPYAPQPMSAPGFERSIATSVILSLVTCGIYAIIWIHAIGKDIRNNLNRDDPNPNMDVLLMFVTCGIWSIYMLYKYPTMINEMLQRRGLPANESLPLISVLLGVFGAGFVSIAMMQSELNKLWQADQMNRPFN